MEGFWCRLSHFFFASKLLTVLRTNARATEVSEGQKRGVCFYQAEIKFEGRGRKVRFGSIVVVDAIKNRCKSTNENKKFIFDIGMKATFPRKNLAINTLIEFRSAEFIYKYTTDITTDSDDDMDFASRYLDLLSDEIHQTINTSNEITKVAFFEELKGEIEDSNLLEVDKEEIENKIKEYNNVVQQKYESMVLEKSKKYFEQPERKHKHLEKYKTYLPPSFDSLETVINHNFFCITDEPPLIDTEQLAKYYHHLYTLTEKFKSIVEQPTKLYDQGKLTSSNSQDKTLFVRGKEWFENNKFIAPVLIIFVVFVAVIGAYNLILDTLDKQKKVINSSNIDTATTQSKNPENVKNVVVSPSPTNRDTIKAREISDNSISNWLMGNVWNAGSKSPPGVHGHVPYGEWKFEPNGTLNNGHLDWNNSWQIKDGILTVSIDDGRMTLQAEVSDSKPISIEGSHWIMKTIGN